MRSPSGMRGMGSAALGIAILAATLMFAAGTSRADRGGDHGSGHGGRTYSGGGGHGNGGGRSYGGGGRAYSGGGGRVYSGGGGGRVYTGGGGGRVYGGGGGRVLADHGGRIYGGGGRYYGGGHYYYGGGPRYRGSYGYRYVRPRTFVSFGIGLGLPYYCPPAYRYYPVPYPVVVESGIDVTNEPPPGCYYYDPYCDREFDNLDDYTDHIDGQDHPRTIEIVRRSSGDRLRTLEFVGGYWSVRR